MAETSADRDLCELQAWFLDVITHPGGVAEGEREAGRTGGRDLGAVLEPSATLDVAQRIGIYAGMYFVRLVEVLDEDFPALAAFLGPDEARRCFESYLVRHPSDHPNLNRLGRRLPAFVAHEATGGPFAAELAQLERGIQEVFDAPRAETLDGDRLLSLTPEAWSELRLPLVPSARVFAFEHPVNDWYQAFRDGDLGPAPVPQASWLLLYRRDFKVWRLALSREQHTLLAALERGAPLAVALSELAELVDVATLGERLREWFQEWGGLGLFTAPPTGT